MSDRHDPKLSARPMSDRQVADANKRKSGGPRSPGRAGTDRLRSRGPGWRRGAVPQPDGSARRRCRQAGRAGRARRSRGGVAERSAGLVFVDQGDVCRRAAPGPRRGRAPTRQPIAEQPEPQAPTADDRRDAVRPRPSQRISREQGLPHRPTNRRHRRLGAAGEDAAGRPAEPARQPPARPAAPAPGCRTPCRHPPPANAAAPGARHRRERGRKGRACAAEAASTTGPGRRTGRAAGRTRTDRPAAADTRAPPSGSRSRTCTCATTTRPRRRSGRRPRVSPIRAGKSRPNRRRRRPPAGSPRRALPAPPPTDYEPSRTSCSVTERRSPKRWKPTCRRTKNCRSASSTWSPAMTTTISLPPYADDDLQDVVKRRLRPRPADLCDRGRSCPRGGPVVHRVSPRPGDRFAAADHHRRRVADQDRAARDVRSRRATRTS